MLDRKVFEGFGMGRINNLIIVVYGQHPPTDQERRHYINYLRTYPNLTSLRLLIYTLGGAPTAAQREESNQLVRDLKLEEQPAAVLMEGILPKMALRELSPCLLYTSPSPRDRTRSRMPSSA